MRLSNVLAFLVIGGIIFWVTGGGALFQLATPTELPTTITPPNATFMGSEQTNPFAE